MGDDKKVKVLYIVGSGRSGSTLLDRMLGQIEGFFSGGEMFFIWHRGLVKNQLCGCGKPLKQCDFWNAVIEEAFGARQNVNEIEELLPSVARTRRIPMLAFTFLRTPEYAEKLRTYSQALSKLYSATQKIAEARVIIDSSKDPSYGFILNQLPSLDVHVLHLVRDSRAVAYSLQRKKPRPEIYWKAEYLPRLDPLRGAVLWDIYNALGQMLKYANPNYSCLQYEQVVEKPRRSLLQIVEYLGEERPGLDFFIGEHAVDLKMNHTVSGNPNRFEHGLMEVRRDDEWQGKMLWSQKFVVTALTWPLLLAYGYWVKRKSQ